MLSGYVINTETLQKKYATGDEYAVSGKRFYQRHRPGAPPASFSISARPLPDLTGKSIRTRTWLPGAFLLRLGAGAHKATFTKAASAGDELSTLPQQECLKNGSATDKDGFFPVLRRRRQQAPGYGRGEEVGKAVCGVSGDGGR
jgi:hypothetical protein